MTTFDAALEQKRWYLIEAASAPFFHLGDRLAVGAMLGRSCYNGQPVRVEEPGRVSGVQYDVWQQRVILEVALEAETPED